MWRADVRPVNQETTVRIYADADEKDWMRLGNLPSIEILDKFLTGIKSKRFDRALDVAVGGA